MRSKATLALLALLGLGGGCANWDQPTAYLRPETSCCRTIGLPGGWRLPADPARAPGYFADDPSARLIYRLDPFSGEIVIGLELPEADQRRAEACPRYFAVSLRSGEVAQVSTERWERARPIAIPFGFWTGSQTHPDGDTRSFLRRFSPSADEDSRASISPDSRFVLVRSRTGRGAITEMGDDRRGEILLDVFAAGSGKQVASARGEYVKAEPFPLLTGEAWISDRHLIFPSRPDHSELILCDLSASSPAGNPVIPVVSERPELLAFDPGPAESWSRASTAFPLLTAVALVPEGEWQFQWRATNPAGRSSVVLVPGAAGKVGFARFETPIPGNDLRDGPYRIDNAAFLAGSSTTRVAIPGVNFLTPEYRYPRSDDTERESAPPAGRTLAPVPLAAVPYWGRGSGGRFSFLALRREGGAEIAAVDVRLSWLPEAGDGCAFRFDTAEGGVRLLDLSGEPAPQIENGFCRVSSPKIERDGNTVTVSAQLEFKPALAGPRGVFVRVVDRSGLASPFELLGAREVR